MAGTGHSYEIANIAEAIRLVDECVAMADDEIASAWFRSKAFLRYATSDKFVFKIRKNASKQFLECVDESERDFIARKHETGADIRLFSLDQFRRSGPDIRHAVDWINMLRHRSPSEHAKLARMSPEDVFNKVKKWIPTNNIGTTLPDGKIRQILKTLNGYTWFELEDAAALVAEGRAMSHCVHGDDYVRAVEAGKARILSMRSTDGARHITMELRLTQNKWYIRQIKAFANGIAPTASIDSICDILNHLKVDAFNDPETRRARVTLTPDGWQSIYKAWDRIEILDMDCVTNGSEIIVMSPIHPERPLLCITKELSGYTAHLSDTRHYSIAELRAAAAAINNFSARIADNRFVTDETEHVLPYFDTLAEENLNGHTFLRDTENRNIYVTAPNDKALLLLEIGHRSRFSLTKETYSGPFAWVSNARQWKDNDAFRCAAALTLTDVNSVSEVSDGDLKLIRRQFDLVRGHNKTWHPFKLEATRHDSKYPDSHWMETNYRICWYYRGNPFVPLDIEENRLLRIPYTWPPRAVECKEIAKHLNKRRITPDAQLIAPKLGSRLTKKRSNTSLLVCIGGRWKDVCSQRELVRMVKCPDNLLAGEAAVILQALPEQPEQRLPEADLLYATCLAIRLASTNGDDVTPLVLDDLKAITWLFENRHLVESQKLQSSLAKIASSLLNKWSKSTKHPFLLGDNEYVRIFHAMWRHLSSALVNRVVIYVFRKCKYWLGRHASDIKWIREIYPTLVNEKAKNAMLNGIEHGSSAYATKDPDILLVNAECLHLYAEHNTILIDYKLELLSTAHDAISKTGYADDRRQIMFAVQKIIDDIPDIVSRRKAEAERKRAEWEQKFLTNSGARSDVAAA